MLLLFVVITFVELGPVVEMVPLSFDGVKKLPIPALFELVTFTVELELAVFEDEPEEALPALVLPLVLAFPVEALWLLLFCTPTELRLLIVARFVLVELTWLFELGPVVPIDAVLAAAKPAMLRVANPMLA